MPRCKPTILIIAALFVSAAVLTLSMGCGNKQDPKPPGGASYYTGDDFKGNGGGGKKMKSFDPTTTTQGK